MKKILSILIALVCVIALFACVNEETTTTTKEPITTTKADVVTTTKEDVTTTKEDITTTKEDITTTKEDDITTETPPEDGIKSVVDSSKQVSKIELDTEPIRQYYLQDDTFDPTGGVILVTYRDKTTDLVYLNSTSFELVVPTFAANTMKAVTVKCGSRASTKVTIYYRTKSFEITYNLAYEGAPQPTVETVVQDDVAKAATPTRDGYTFVNWYANKDYMYVYDFSSPVTENATVYALWKKNGADHYAVTFKKGYYGDLYATYSYESPSGEAVAKPTNPERYGYTFDKWVKDDGTAYDFSAPLTGPLTLTATWIKALSGKQTYTFEAEDTSLAKKVGPAYSGTCSEEGMIVPAPKDRGCSNGYFVSYLYREENSLEFFVVCDEDISDVTIYARLSAELRDYTFDPSNYRIELNGVALDYEAIEFKNVPRAEDLPDPASQLDCLPFQNYLLGINLTLKKGQNLIQLITKNSVGMEGSTLEAAAPIVDAIVIETTAVLQWDHVMGLPVTSNYAPRNPSEY